MQAYVSVPLHQLVDQSVRVRCAHSPSWFWRRGHCGHGWIRATLGDGFGHPAAIPDGVAEHDWHRRWQTCAGIVGTICKKRRCLFENFHRLFWCSPSAVNFSATRGEYCFKNNLALWFGCGCRKSITLLNGEEAVDCRHACLSLADAPDAGQKIPPLSNELRSSSKCTTPPPFRTQSGVRACEWKAVVSMMQSSLTFPKSLNCQTLVQRDLCGAAHSGSPRTDGRTCHLQFGTMRTARERNLSKSVPRGCVWGAIISLWLLSRLRKQFFRKECKLGNTMVFIYLFFKKEKFNVNCFLGLSVLTR